ncbi:restriction endonuclease [Arthrobacter sp. KBS0702]|uniref:restriction endonuclease n=1 Tax=Arthrobacter sp. KBS0702 TaxID=2578107 RepID=UPI001643C31A|nr:restriction endonuclease [Arthrobacter sp. KBS0702]
MKIAERIILGDLNKFQHGEAWEQAETEIEAAIHAVVWPPGAIDFTIQPARKGNGVVPIKAECMSSLKAAGWEVERRFGIPGDVRPGPIDAQKEINGDVILLEWETGNISSSHRALNKMAVGIKSTNAIAGVLIVPSADCAKYLTDRIGNIRELRPYFPIWEEWASSYGFLAIYVVEHDNVDSDVQLIGKGLDGRARGAVRA